MRNISVFACACVCLLLSPALRGAVDPTDVPAQFFGKVIRSIVYSADQPVDVAHLDPEKRIREGQPLSREWVKSAIQFLYESGRFAGIAVEALPEADGVRIQFHLRFNYYFNEFLINGKVDFGGRAGWEVLNLPTGQRFSPQALDEARKSVIEYLQGRGYFSAEVDTRTVTDRPARLVEVTFDVRPGNLATIKSVVVEGVPEADLPQLRDRIGIRPGQRYDPSRLRRKLDLLKDYLVKRGYLAAVPNATETFNPADHTVALRVGLSNFGKFRVVIEGFKIPKDQLRRLLPVLAGEGLGSDILDEGARNIRDHLEELGYPEAEVDRQQETDKSGSQVVRYLVAPGRKTTIAFIRFRGNRVLSGEELQAVIPIQKSRFLQKSAYSISKLDSSVQSITALYQSKGYLGVKVIPLIEPVREGERLGITFECEEGPIFRTTVVQVQGNLSLPPEVLNKNMSLSSGGPYSPFLAERDRQNLLTAYNDAGFLQAKVDYRASPSPAADSYKVDFDIQEGVRSYVDNIIIYGQHKTRESVIRKQIALKDDAPLSLGKMLQSQQSLYRLGVFDLVRVAPRNPDSTASYQDIAVRLEESKKLMVRYGIGYQEREKVRGTIDISHLNLWGTAHRADLQLRGSSVEQGAVLTIQQPVPVLQFQNVNSYFTTAARKRQEVSFDQTRVNFAYQFSRPLSSHSWILPRYNFINVRLPKVNVSPDQIPREDRERNLSTFSTTYVNDTRDDYLDPTKGFFTSTDLAFTTILVGNGNYLALYSQNSYFRPLPARFLLAVSMRLGLQRPFGAATTVPISERYFAGGGASLRGFETDYAGPLDPLTNKPLGGNALAIGNLEVKFPLFRMVYLAGFYDVGNVFAKIEDIKPSGFSHTIGLGIRIKTPFGPLRVDYGYNLNLSSDLQQRGLKRGHLFLTIGPPF
jgi:outer membrane protein insertion porin family